MIVQLLNKKHFFTILCLSFAFSPGFANSSGASDRCEGVLASGRPAARNDALSTVIINNSFHVARGWGEYEDQFPGFTFYLGSLGRQARWLDAGAGEIFAATEMLTANSESPYLAAEFLDTNLRDLTLEQRTAMAAMADLPLSERPQITAISFRVKREIAPLPNLRIIKDKFFEEIPQTKLREFDVITDLFGVFSYSHAVDQVLASYLGMIDDRGRIYLHFDPEKTQISTPQGKTLSLLDWLEAIKGIKVTSLNGHKYSFMVSKVPGVSIIIPRLVLDSVQHVVPPPRRFYYQRN